MCTVSIEAPRASPPATRKRTAGPRFSISDRHLTIKFLFCDFSCFAFGATGSKHAPSVHPHFISGYHVTSH
jgi:hypothetical protein